MRAVPVLFAAVAMLLLNGQGPTDEQEPEHPKITSSSEAFRQSLTSSTDALSKAKFEDDLQKPALGASRVSNLRTCSARSRQRLPLTRLVRAREAPSMM